MRFIRLPPQGSVWQEFSADSQDLPDTPLLILRTAPVFCTVGQGVHDEAPAETA